ncbi:MAG: IS1380 family transposase [Salinibacter sp.]|uniref:IS1380 family transposase n=1 Tax=Salinibacter sp. TaxID=2065818 RepID=UPI0035D47396
MTDTGAFCNSEDFDSIDQVETTGETLTSRAGMVLFSRYLRNLGLLSLLERLFGSLRKSEKGLPIPVLFHQIICFFLDGTRFSLVRFDELKAEDGYAGAIEVSPESMASSHQIKRFFYGFSLGRIWLFRRLIQQVFLWRLWRTCSPVRDPEVVILGMDTEAWDNDGAEKREGVEPTYKGVEGFHPFQVTWGRFVADALPRGGSKHSNDGETATKAIRHLTKKIRKALGKEIPIVVRMDAGFCDEEIYQACEELGIGYVSSGRLLEEIREEAGRRAEEWSTYQNDSSQSDPESSREWAYYERGDRRGTWSQFRRMIYVRLRRKEGQRKLAFARKDSVIYTNLGQGGPIDRRLKEAGKSSLIQTENVIETHHGRGRDELVHRALKDFGTERMPFEGFFQNMAFYSMMLLSFNLYEAFKEDAFGAEEPEGSEARIPLSSYAIRLRREVIDIAGKLVKTGRQMVLKVTEATARRLDLGKLFRQVADPPRFVWR